MRRSINTGAGIYMDNIAAGTFTPTITNCTIGNNSSHGMYVSGNFGNKGKPNVIDSVISSNGASGVYFSQTGSDSPFSGNFLRCTISSNKTYGIYGTGGGIGYPAFTNCLVTRNGSGGIYFTGDGKGVTISRCTVADNGGYGVSLSMSSVVPETLADCIVYSNTTASLLYNQASSLYVSYSDIQGGCPAGTVEISNINADPLFVSSANNDYHEKSKGGTWNGSGWTVYDVHSPCIDAGDPTMSYANEPTPNGQRINMGRYGNTIEASKKGVQQGMVFYMR